MSSNQEEHVQDQVIHLLEGQKQELQTLIGYLMFENGKIKSNEERLYKEKKDLYSKYIQQESEFSKLKKEFHNLQLQNLQLKQDVALHKQSYSTLQDQLTAMTTRREQLNQEVESLQMMLKGVKNMHKLYSDEHSSQTKFIQFLNVQRSTDEKQIMELTEQNMELSSQLLRAKEELSHQRR